MRRQYYSLLEIQLLMYTFKSSQVKSSLRLFRPPLTQTQRGLQDHKKKITKQNK